MSTFVQYMYCAQCVIVWMSPPPLLEMGHICFFRMGVVSVLFPKCWGGGGILLGGRGEIKPENLEKITSREKVLASAMDAVSTVGKGNKPTKVEALVEKRAANRTSGGMER